jgi:F0F1-type ATP synthase alpha subunit
MCVVQHIGKIVWLFADTTNHTRTEIIEECMSIADGQIVLNQSTDSTTIPRLDVAQSLSRMGTRAYYPAVKDLAPKV